MLGTRADAAAAAALFDGNFNDVKSSAYQDDIKAADSAEVLGEAAK